MKMAAKQKAAIFITGIRQYIIAKRPLKPRALKEAINMAYPDFTENIQALCPSLSDKEIKVCLLSKSDISPSGVAEILKCSRQAITNIRTRLYKKITSYGNNFKDFDHFISSL